MNSKNDPEKKIKHPLSRNIYIVCILFTVMICAVTGVISYLTFKKRMMEQYESHLKDIIHLTASQADIRDLKDYIETGKETEKLKDFQFFLDNVKQNYTLDHIVLSLPVKKDDIYDVIYVAGGLRPDEKSGEAIIKGLKIPEHGDSIAYVFPPEMLPEIYREFHNTEDVNFIVSTTEYGITYRGGYSLRDKNGDPVVLITAGLSANLINTTLKRYMLLIIFSTTVLGIVFLSVALYWLRKRVIQPISLIEKAARNFEEKSRDEADPSALILDIPEIITGDEMESLAETLSEMSFRMKSYIDFLLQSEMRMNSLEQNLDESRKKAMQLGEMAIRDPLTGIRNKTAYDVEYEKIAEELKSGNTKVAIAMIGLNNLGLINDTYGHEKGNEAIKKLCRLVCLTFAHSPVFRIGGDEFVAILKGSDYENSSSLIDSFNREQENYSADESLEPWERISAAIGCSAYTGSDNCDLNQVFRRADEKMYQRKKEMKSTAHPPR